MADPKYANLPGIVHDQPDVYETEDLPESEQHYAEPEVDCNPAIEVLHISSVDAFKKFRGKVLSSDFVDFSDSISGRKKTGYRTRPVEYDIGDEENVVQKYQRLKAEVTELAKEIEDVKEDISHGGGKVSVSELSEQVESLNSLMVNLNLEKQLGQDVLLSLSEPQVSLEKKLESLLQKLKSSNSSDKKQSQKTSESVDGVKYEIYYAAEHAKLNQLSQAANLEKRLDTLETLVGNNPDKLSTLSTWTNHKSLLDAVQALSSRLSLLEPSHLDQVEGRLHGVHTKMNTIAEKKTVIEDSNKLSKVNDIFEMMKKTESYCSALPDVVERLLSVESLHDEAMKFAQQLKQLDVVYTQVSGQVESNSQIMLDIQKMFAENLDKIQKNTKSLEERISKLPKK